jgi:hypothetical protein
MSIGSSNSPMRKMMADAEGVEYATFDSLLEAKGGSNGIVVLEGDDGGQIYLVARVCDVICAEPALRQLLLDVDARAWNCPEMAHLCFEQREIGEGIAGGMGGAIVTEEPWVHPRLQMFRESMLAVLSGTRERLVE